MLSSNFKFLLVIWAYLLVDNLPFYRTYFETFARTIRNKVLSLGCFFPLPCSDGGFNVCGSIDNTMNATCRPDGGPCRDGTNAPRNAPPIQRAWYNGWKKIHGMKWLTFDFPCGCNGHVFGPLSVRRNDLFSLSKSILND